MAKHLVKCAICNKQFDANAEEYVKVNSKRYAHLSCSLLKENSKTQDEKDREKLIEYIKNLFHIKTLTPLIKMQLKKYLSEEYKYSYSGILKSLIYFFEIKGNSIDKANGGIGIVPYIYDQAFRYYYSLWEAQQINNDKDIEVYIPKVKVVRIPRPKPKNKKRNLFSFLDEDEVEE